MLRRKKPKLKFNNILLSKNLQAGTSKTARAEKKKGISQAKIPTLENLKTEIEKGSWSFDIEKNGGEYQEIDMLPKYSLTSESMRIESTGRRAMTQRKLKIKNLNRDDPQNVINKKTHGLNLLKKEPKIDLMRYTNMKQRFDKNGKPLYDQ